MQAKEVVITEAKSKTYLINETEDIISVCAYCRVSTDKSDQRNSLEAQKRFFNSEFKSHPNWAVKTVFADEGISGTSLKKRDEFNRMIAECRRGNYQLIITKEVSRFSRNVKDILNIVTELHDMGVFIWFLTDDIYTEESDYREKLIKASEQAEAESRKTSKRVKWGQRRQMENGTVFGRINMYGYDIVRNEDGEQHFQIIPEEAEVVRRIFHMYASGQGTFKIARQLEREGVKTKRYKNGWSNVVILRMLRNEKYVGDLEQGKTYTPDYLTHEKKYNRGESAKFYITDHHKDSAIVDRDLWNRVQVLLRENTTTDEQKEKHSNRYWCSGKVICGECGRRYVSRTKKIKSGTYKSWRCFESQQFGGKRKITTNTGEQLDVGCNSESVNDKVLRQGIYDIITQIIEPRFTEILEQTSIEYENRISTEAASSAKQIAKLQTQADEITATLGNLAIMLANGQITKIAYAPAAAQKESELQDIYEEIARLHSLSADETAQKAELEWQLEILQNVIKLKDDQISDEIFRSVIDKIEVCNGHILKYHLIALTDPIVLKYRTSGRLDKYTVEFDVVE